MNSSCFFHPPIHLLSVLKSTQPLVSGLPGPESCGPQAVFADKLLQFGRVFQEGAQKGFLGLFFFGMFFYLVRGLAIQFVGIILNLLGEGVWIESSLHDLEMLNELKRNIVGGDIE